MKVISNTKWILIINVSIALFLIALELHGQGTEVSTDGAVDKSWSSFDLLDLMYTILLFVLIMGNI